jgi:AcrR family transcriptional regulator
MTIETTDPAIEAARPRRGRPPRFDHRRDEVLRAAARTFSECGFKHATLEDVANQLGISRPALYHYSNSKDELLGDCAKMAQEQLREAHEQAQAEAATGLDQIYAYFLRYAEVINGDFGRCFVLTDRRELNPEVKEFARVIQLDALAAVEGMIALGMKDGSVRPCDPYYAARALFGAFNGLPRWFHPGSTRSTAEVAESFLTLIFDGLRGPGKPNGNAPA